LVSSWQITGPSEFTAALNIIWCSCSLANVASSNSCYMHRNRMGFGRHVERSSVLSIDFIGLSCDLKLCEKGFSSAGPNRNLKNFSKPTITGKQINTLPLAIQSKICEHSSGCRSAALLDPRPLIRAQVWCVESLK